MCLYRMAELPGRMQTMLNAPFTAVCSPAFPPPFIALSHTLTPHSHTPHAVLTITHTVLTITHTVLTIMHTVLTITHTVLTITYTLSHSLTLFHSHFLPPQVFTSQTDLFSSLDDMFKACSRAIPSDGLVHTQATVAIPASEYASCVCVCVFRLCCCHTCFSRVCVLVFGFTTFCALSMVVRVCLRMPKLIALLCVRVPAWFASPRSVGACLCARLCVLIRAPLCVRVCVPPRNRPTSVVAGGNTSDLTAGEGALPSAVARMSARTPVKAPPLSLVKTIAAYTGTSDKELTFDAGKLIVITTVRHCS